MPSGLGSILFTIVYEMGILFSRYYVDFWGEAEANVPDLYSKKIQVRPRG